MGSTVDPKKTYIGVVENNNDPQKIGRCQVRVMDVYENIPIKDLPWATPWKDLNGNQFNIPDKGKVVTVVFENGNKNNPEYLSSDHYNINLERKLNSLNETDYLSMKSLFFDHKTQMYVNDSEGFKIDHKFNNINIKEQSIDINLKDNFGKLNIGSQNSTQRAILGDNFTNWFDEFLDILIGKSGGGFLGNLGVPSQATPALISHIQKYFSIKTSKILSKNVYIVDNEHVKVLERVDDTSFKGSPTRFYDPTIGDYWNSTVEENKITKKEEAKFEPIPGPTSKTFDKPKEDVEKPVAPVDLAPKVEESNPDVEVLIQLLKNKNYKLYDRPFEVNIVAIRNQCLSIGQNYTNDFSDDIYIFYRDNYNKWHIKKYKYSTMPGSEFTLTETWLNQQKLETNEIEYWKSKINTKITLKEFYKGVPKITINNNPSNESLLNKKTVTDIDTNLKDTGLDPNKSSLSSLSNIPGTSNLDMSILSPTNLSNLTSSTPGLSNLDTNLNTKIPGLPTNSPSKPENLDKVPTDLSTFSKTSVELPNVIKDGNKYISFGRGVSPDMNTSTKIATLDCKSRLLNSLQRNDLEINSQNANTEKKVFRTEDGSYLTVIKIEYTNSQNNILLLDKQTLINLIKDKKYDLEIANKNIKSFNYDKFIVSNSIDKTRSNAKLKAMDISQFILDNKVKPSTDQTTYLKEKDGNIDLLYIIPVEK